MGSIYQEVEWMVYRHGTRDPFELLDAIGAVTWLSYEFDADGLKGFAAIMNDIPYAAINGNLPAEERRIVAGHEAAHLILHKKEILQSPAGTIRDFNLYDGSGRLEFEANSFLADFLVSDEQAAEVMEEAGWDYFFTAKMLHLPPPLLTFKLRSMIQRGHDIKNPATLQSRFLGKNKVW